MSVSTSYVTATSNRFQVLEDEVRDEPSFTLVGDSLVRHQDEEFCIQGPRRKHACFPGRKIEDITERIDDLVANSSDESVFVYLVGTNNVVRGGSEGVLRKYKEMVRKLRDSRRRSVVCGLIPRFDANPSTLSRMLGINARLEDLCRKEGVMYVDVWDHFSSDRSLYGKDGLHLNRVGKARLGRVLDEGMRKELEQSRESSLGEARRVPPVTRGVVEVAARSVDSSTVQGDVVAQPVEVDEGTQDSVGNLSGIADRQNEVSLVDRQVTHPAAASFGETEALNE